MAARLSRILSNDAISRQLRVRCVSLFILFSLPSVEKRFRIKAYNFTLKFYTEINAPDDQAEHRDLV